jgi:hypothetical protein
MSDQQQSLTIVFGLTRPRLEPTIYRTRDEHATYYTTDVVKSILEKRTERRGIAFKNFL